MLLDQSKLAVGVKTLPEPAAQHAFRMLVAIAINMAAPQGAPAALLEPLRLGLSKLGPSYRTPTAVVQPLLLHPTAREQRQKSHSEIPTHVLVTIQGMTCSAGALQATQPSTC